MSELKFVIEKSPRIARLIHDLYENMPEIEADRAETARMLKELQELKAQLEAQKADDDNNSAQQEKPE